MAQQLLKLLIYTIVSLCLKHKFLYAAGKLRLKAYVKRILRSAAKLIRFISWICCELLGSLAKNIFLCIMGGKRIEINSCSAV